ncbi:hypothetical protein SBC1_53470 (plasmid) [Caballeronia sp. SBC1]|nr:hypothetical protein SBC2_52890 [Caballeronia sp. SBC2]QIN65302.1 hypothetical protein SBC1_53470 [Caballeronia sp. SBC1]
MLDSIDPHAPSRRRFIGVATASLAAASLSRYAFAETSQSITEVAPPGGGDKAAIRDSPIGLAAWMLDHDAASQAMIARVFDGQPEGLSRDDVLDNVTLYWLTNTGVSSARLYWENKLNFFAPKHVAIPVAVSVFPDEIFAAPQSWTEKAYPKLIHYNRLPKGGRFAAWEQPQAFTEEFRVSFRTLR